MGNMDHLETLKNEVFRSLGELNLEELTELTNELKINVPPNRRGKQSSVMRTMVQYLMSDEVQDEDDEGLEVFQLITTVLDRLLSVRQTVETEEVKVEVAVDNGVLQNADGSGSSRGPTLVAVSQTASVTPTSSTTTSQVGSSATAAAASTITNNALIPSTGPIDQLATILVQQLTDSVRMNAGVQQSAMRTEVRRLRDFKVNGVVGNGDGQLDYAALM